MDQAPDSKQSEILKQVKELVDEVYTLKQASDEAEKKYKDAKNRLSKIMEDAEIDKMQGDQATASLALKTSVSCPKDDADKLAVFNYLACKDNPDHDAEQDVQGYSLIEKLSAYPTLLSMLTINARTFSSWYDKEVAQKAEEGDFEFKVPGTAPYDYYSVGLRKLPKKKA